MSRLTYTVKFWNQNSWNIYEEYGPTMREVALRRGAQLAELFGAVEVISSEGDLWKL